MHSHDDPRLHLAQMGRTMNGMETMASYTPTTAPHAADGALFHIGCRRANLFLGRRSTFRSRNFPYGFRLFTTPLKFL